MIDDGHRESGVGRVGHERHRVVAGAADDQRRWRDQHVGEHEMRVERVERDRAWAIAARRARQIAIETRCPVDPAR